MYSKTLRYFEYFKELNLSGVSNNEIILSFINEFKISRKQAKKIINKIMNSLSKIDDGTLLEVQQKCMSRLEFLYKKLVEERKYADAAKVIKIIADVKGITKVDNRTLVQVSPDYKVNILVKDSEVNRKMIQEKKQLRIVSPEGVKNENI